MIQRIDFTNTLRSGIPRGILQPRRSQIYVGFSCHQRCGFCYYKHKCHEDMFPLENIKRQIDFKLKYGIVDFEITGGEPGEFKSLVSVCKYIKSASPRSRIAVITNGSLVSQPECLEYVDEVLLSYHLSRRQHVDEAFFPLGCTWTKIKRLSDLANQSGCLVRTNTVLGTFNLDGIQEIVEDLVEISPKIINFLPVNLFDQASDLAKFIDYQSLRPKLKFLVDQLKSFLPNSLIFIRYMPFCDMEGYQKHIVGYLQHIYDWFDWNVELGGSDFLDKLKQLGESKYLESLGEYGSTSLKAALDSRNSFYSKSIKCLRCKYQLICDGIESKIPASKIDDFAVPSRDFCKIYKNPLEFIGETSKKLYDQLYNQPQ